MQSEIKTIKSGQDAYNFLKYHLYDLNHEQFKIMLLNRTNSVLHFTKISQGGLSATLVDLKLISLHLSGKLVG